jgi:hypothetical protein
VDSVERKIDNTGVCQELPILQAKPDGSGKPAVRSFTGRGLETDSRMILTEELLKLLFKKQAVCLKGYIKRKPHTQIK